MANRIRVKSRARVSEVAKSLTKEQNELARSLIRQLWAGGKGKWKTEASLGKAIGIHQTRISALMQAGSNDGTTSAVLIQAGKLLGREEDVAKVLGMRQQSGIPPSSKEKYAGRQRAIEAARLLKYDEDAILHILGLSLPPNEKDPGERWWFERIQRREEEIRDPLLARSASAARGRKP